MITLPVILPLAASGRKSCEEFPATQNTLWLTPASKSACFSVAVLPGAAMQFTAAQPVDIEFVINGKETKLQADSFEFGPETATLTVPGTYQLQLKSAGANSLPHRFLVSRKLLTLQKGLAWRNAENAATESKRNPGQAMIAESLALWLVLNEKAAIARTYLKEGDFHDAQHAYAAARAAYEAALAMCDAEGDIRCQAEAANNSGLASQRLGDFELSLTRLESAARSWRTLHDSTLEGATLSNLGLLFWHTNDFQQALSFDARAADVLRHTDRLRYARVLTNTGLCYQSLAEFNTAQKYFEQARTIERQHPAAGGDAIRTEIDLGRNFMLQGQAVKGQAVLKRVRAEAAGQGDRPALADTLNNLAQSVLAQNHVEEALPLLENALQLHRAVRDRRGIALDWHYLGVAAMLEHDAAAARSSFAEALSIEKQIELREPAIDSLYALSSLERKAGNSEVARGLVSEALTMMETVRVNVPGPALRASFAARRRKLFDLLIDIDLGRGVTDGVRTAFLTSERGQGRALLDLLAESSVLGSPPPELVEKHHAIERRIDILSLLLSAVPQEQVQPLRNQVQLLVAQQEEVDAQIRSAQPEQKFGQPLASVEQLQHELLPPGAALLEYHLGAEKSSLWLVDAKGIEVFALPPQTVIEQRGTEALALFGRILDRQRSPELQRRFERVLDGLSGALLEPLRGRRLPSTLILVCDGILHRIPFEALRVPASATRLGLAHDVVRVPSAGYLAVGREVRPVKDFARAFLGIADPVFSRNDARVRPSSAAKAENGGLPRLPLTAEFDAVAALTRPSGRTVLRGFAANRGSLLKLPLQDFAVLHFSTHALMDDTIPELSRVALSLVDRKGNALDGFLRPNQFAGLHLEGSAVVLSACETALGKQVMGEGMAGLSSSLLHAGASQLVLTLARVDAEASSEFFSQVYRGVFGPQAVPMEHALTLARRALAKSRRWSDPYYWSPFILVGRPSGAIITDNLR